MIVILLITVSRMDFCKAEVAETQGTAAKRARDCHNSPRLPGEGVCMNNLGMPGDRMRAAAGVYRTDSILVTVSSNTIILCRYPVTHEYQIIV